MVLSPRRDATQHSTTASHNELVVRRARDIRNTFILLERGQRNPQTLSRRATRDATSEAASACAARDASATPTRSVVIFAPTKMSIFRRIIHEPIQCSA